MKELEELIARREMAAYQRKITTSYGTVVEYDQEIYTLDRKIDRLKKKLKENSENEN